MDVQELLAGVRPVDEAAAAEAKRRWDSIAKPLGSLGVLEDMICRVAAIRGSAEVSLARRAVVVMCADNGVVAEGVTQTGQEVTAVVTENMSSGDTSVCRMARAAGAEVVPVDIGVARPVTGARILQRCIRRGTDNIARGPAMTREECERAIVTGAEIVRTLAQQGYELLATGEMGIGNTTTSSAVTAVLLGREPGEVTGRGAGLSSEGLRRKIAAIERAIAVNRPRADDVIDVLSKVGGLDIAGLAGVFLGGAAFRVPVLVDGFISAVAALAAVRLCPAARPYVLASHVSNEPAGAMVLDALGLEPPLHARMCLGEGTGAVAAMPLFDLALSVYNEMRTFGEIEIESYTPQV